MQHTILLSVLATFLSAQNPPKSPAAAGHLTGPREQSANAMQPPERLGQEAKEAGFQLEAMIEDRPKGDNIFILRPIVPDAPESRDRQKVRALWEAYLAWMKADRGGKSPRDYAVSLYQDGVPAPEIRRRLQILRGQFTEQPEGIEMIYDPLYSTIANTPWVTWNPRARST